jgi:hypothetical protein
MAASHAKSEEPKRSDYGAVSVDDVGDNVDNAYCTEYELPDYPTISDYLTYPYRCGILPCYENRITCNLICSGLLSILFKEYAITLDGNLQS